MKNEFGEGISETVKLTIMTSMMPMVIQDFVYTYIDKSSKYDQQNQALKEIRPVVSNKVSMSMASANAHWRGGGQKVSQRIFRK